MKTLLVTIDYKPFRGGVSEYYSKLFDFWPNKNIFVLTRKTKEDVVESKRVLRRDLISPVFSWLVAFYEIFVTVKKFKIQHIIVGQILPLGTVVWMLSKILNFKYTVIMHGMDYTYCQKKKRKKFLRKKILLSSQNIILGNSYLLKLVKKDYPEIQKKLHVINPGVSFSDFEKYLFDNKKSENENGLGLVFIGRLVKRKGVDRVIESLSLLDERKYPGIRFVVAGIGPDEEYFKNISKDSRIKFVGRISDEEKWKMFSKADVFIMPSREIDGDFEGFGIVYMEANLAGLPVIASNSGGVSDAVVDNVNGLLLEDDKPESIKSAIVDLYENKKLRIELGERGRERALKKFVWKDKIIKIYNIINK